MARGRMLSTKIAEDEDFNDMSIEAQFMFMRAVPHLDRDGIITGNPTLLWAKIAPLLPQYAAKMKDVITEWANAGFVLQYTDEKKRGALLFKGFTKNQSGLRYDREARSEFGVPPGYRWTPDGLVEIECSGGQNDDENEPADKLRTNSGKAPDKFPLEVEDQVEDQDQSTLESGNENGSHAPARNGSAEELDELMQELESVQAEACSRQQAAPDTQAPDPKSLELMRRWSRDKPATKPVKVRIPKQQAAIVAAEPPLEDPPSRVQAASFQPLVDPNRVISPPAGEKIIIQESAWTQMMGAMFDGFGWRDLASTGSVKIRNDTARCLETLCKMSPKFRTKDGILELFESWRKARPDYPTPKPDWLEEHASLFLAGMVRYPSERKNQHERRSPGSDGNRATSAEELYPEYAKFGA